MRRCVALADAPGGRVGPGPWQGGAGQGRTMVPCPLVLGRQGREVHVGRKLRPPGSPPAVGRTRRAPEEAPGEAEEEGREADEAHGGDVDSGRSAGLQVERGLHEGRRAADVAHRQVEGQPEAQGTHGRREELRAEVVGLRNGEARGRPKDDGERREGHPEVAGERREHDVDGERDGCQNHGSDRVRREGVRIEVPVAHPCGNDTSDQDARHQQRGQPERLSLAQAAVCLVRSSPDARVEGAATARGASEANEDGQAVLAQDPEDAHPIHARRARRLAGPLLRCDSLARKRLAVNNVVRKGAG
eukprot:CAMPEP_0170297180 /NCGR_PEP_ID=MMETSP0116_2-20130129/48750_1 /TAXON_ID=400756 /ORGANISM="Durinskia baltica, Strain CSIRO CS-38" /LENGTH=302 /DNA_ID=CAMNT_0010548803 /DNA_START=200 /DNA_END=1105 /DNA_ORIENTATION=+